MGTTYIAWDGNEYEWPPPKGWYQAIDNRWWAPDTGPVAMGENQPPPTDATVQMEQGSEILNPAAARQENIEQSDLPAWAKPNEELVNQSSFGEPENHLDNQTNNTPLILGIAVAAFTLLFLLFVYFVFIRGGDDPKTAEPSPETQTITTPTTVTQKPVEVTEPEETFTYELSVTQENKDAFTKDLEELEIEFDGISLEQRAKKTCEDFNQAKDNEDYKTLIGIVINNTQQSDEDNQTDFDERISLTDQEKIIDATLKNFCPSVAERLEVS